MCFEFCTNQNILVTMLRIDQENGGKISGRRVKGCSLILVRDTMA
jgi:hypothetical protein